MIVPFVIDWADIGRRINGLEDLAGLCMQLHYLRHAIMLNGILYVHRAVGKVKREIFRSIKVLRELGEGELDPCIMDLISELTEFQTLYENNSYILDGDAIGVVDNDRSLLAVREADAHLARVSELDRACKKSFPPAVYITNAVLENGDAELKFFTPVSIDEFARSEVDRRRLELARGQRVGAGREAQFDRCVKGFAASVQSEVYFFDPYFSSVLLDPQTDKLRNTKNRYLASLPTLLKAFVRNRDINEIVFVSKRRYRVEHTGRLQLEPIRTREFRQKIYEIIRDRVQKLAIKIILLEEDNVLSRDSAFHDRFIISPQYTLGIGRGIDVCGRDSCLRVGINMILWGHTLGNGNLMRMANIEGHRQSHPAVEDIDCGEKKFAVGANLNGIDVENVNVTMEFV